jgi:methyl-accepting chemotaxis protein
MTQPVSQWTIQRKVNAISAASLCLSLAAIALCAFGLFEITKSLDAIVTTGDALQSHQLADMMHDALRGDVQRGLLAEDPKELAEAAKDLADHSKTFLDAMDENERRGLSGEVAEALKASKIELRAYIAAAEEMLAHTRKDSAQAKKEIPRFLQHFEALEEKNEAISKLIEGQVNAARLHVRENIQQTGVFLAGIAFLILLTGAGTAILLHRIVSDLKRKLAQVSDGVAIVADIAAEIGASSNQVLSAAAEQASSLERTSDASGTIRKSGTRNAELTRMALETVGQTTLRIENANERLQEMVSSISGIQEASKKISKIIQVIETIAFQTNLLALNAAVEAARAGETGAGFAVVADEVRALAMRCTEAAKDTASLIEESMQRSQEGSERVQRVAAVIRELTADSSKVQSLVGEVTSVTEIQFQGVTDVAQLIIGMQKINGRSEATMRNAATAADALSEESENLRLSAEELTRLAVAC